MPNHSMTTTIFSLPNELLVAVALAGQEERVAETFSRGSNWQNQSAENFKSEWILSRLSQRFRRVIIGVPTLWTLAEADLDDEGSVRGLKLYLERSQTCKTSITLRQSRASGLAYDLVLKRVQSLIPAHFNRVRRLRVALWDWRETMKSIFRDAAAPHLEHLEVVNFDRNVRKTGAMFSRGAPNLNFLRADDLEVDASAAPWTASLTHLELRCRVELHTRAIIAQCPRLVHLHLDSHLHMDGSGSRVHIPTLASLHLSIVSGETVHYLLAIVNLFDTPAVMELRIEGSHGDQIGALFNSTPPFHMSFPVLTTLSFVYRDVCGCDAGSTGFYYPRFTDTPPSRLFPALASLTLVNECFTPDLVRDVLGSDAPFLESATVYLRYDDDLEGSESYLLRKVRNAFEDVRNWRRQRGDPLPKVTLFLRSWSFYDWSEGDSASMNMAMIW